MPDPMIAWLLEGDLSIQYQTYRDLLGRDRPDLRSGIATTGWGSRILRCRNGDGSWGRGFYQPKWTSTHYTLLDLKSLQIAPDHDAVQESVRAIARTQKASDGGINPAGSVKESDVCINGMYLNYACYFGEVEEVMTSVVDFILSQRMEDGGFNCRRNRSGARHSSLHSTLCVAEGIQEYIGRGYQYRVRELEDAAASSREFILQHRLYRSDHTGETIHKDLLRLAFPPRWKFNILRALDYFRAAGASRDPRMNDAIAVLQEKRRRDGRWPLQSAHPGEVHFAMERAGEPSRWNTLLSLRVLHYFGSDERFLGDPSIDRT